MITLFANGASTIITAGGTTSPAPSAGTSETWTVASPGRFPSAVTGVSLFYIVDQAAPSELMAVTNVSGSTWTVTRGAESVAGSTTPVVHAPGCTVWLITSAGTLAGMLTAANNLSDVGSAAIARANIIDLVPTAVQTGNTSANPGDLVVCDASSGSFQVQLPTAPADKTRIGAAMIGTNTQLGYQVSVLPGGSDVFGNTGNAAPRTLSVLNQTICLQYKASNATWYVLWEHLGLNQLKQLFPADWLNPKGFGATGNGKMVTDAGINVSVSATTLNSASAAFTASDVGKIGVIMGAGALNGSAGIPLPFTISAFVSSTQVTISATATTTVTNATCYFGADDKNQLQATIAACANGQTVSIPNAIYLCSSNLSITKPMRLTGDGATLVFTNSAGIDFGNTYISAASGGSTNIGLEIDHLIFDVCGGHVFQNLNANKFTFHDLRLSARSYNSAVLFVNTSSDNQLDGYFLNIVTRVYGAPRTVQAWYILSSIGGGAAMLTWQNCLWQNNDLDSSQYFMEIDCTGTHNYTNNLTFDNCWFDSAYGGCVKLLSCQAAAFRSCNIIDSFSKTWGNSAYYIGAYSGGSNWASQKILFQSCSRDLQGPSRTASPATWDIECESTSNCITVSNYLVRDILGVSTFFPQFNFHGCTNVLVMNCDDAIIDNSGVSQVTLGPSGNVGFTGSLTGATQPPVVLPSDAGYLSWTFDPTMLAGGSTPGTGVLILAAVYLRTAQTVSSVVFGLSTAAAAGVTLTSGENFAGLYSNAGSLLSGSADQTSAWASASIKTVNLTSAQPLGAGWYWAAILLNFSGSGTNPQVARGSTLAIGGALGANAGSSGGSRRYAQITGQAYVALPPSFTPNSALSEPTFALWAGVK